jgi:hypothetical protein
MPMLSAVQAKRVHCRVAVNQESSSRLVKSAPIANANGIENPTKPVYSKGG